MTSVLVSIPSCTKQSTGCTSSPCRQNPLQSITGLRVFYVKTQMQLNTFKSSKGSPWKLGFKLFWMRQPSKGVPRRVQLLLCSMQTDRKASWGIGYFMSIKLSHVNYQIISHQSKSLSALFLRRSPNRPWALLKTRLHLCFLCSMFSCARCFHHLNKWGL